MKGLQGLFIIPLIGLALILLSAGCPRAAEFKIAVDLLPQSLDPHAGTALSDPTFIHPCYDRLTAYADRTSNVVPSLALTWRVSADQQKYTFVLQQGRTFSDGRQVDAQAVRYSFKRLLGPGGQGRALFPTIRAIQVLGPYTVRFTLDRPTPSFLASLAGTPASIVSPGCADHPPGFLDRHTLGSGLYQLDQWSPGNDITLRARTDISGRPRIDRIVGLVQPDPEQLAEMLTQGDIHLAHAPPTRPEFQNTGPGLPWRVREFPALSFYYLALNCKQPRLSTITARQALARAIDYTSLMEYAAPGLGRPMTGVLPEGMWGRLEPADDSPQDAMKQPEQVPVLKSPDKNLVIIYSDADPVPQAIAEHLRDSLHRAGLPADIHPFKPQKMTQALQTGAYDVVVQSAAPRTGHPHPLLAGWLSTPGQGSANTAYYENKDAVEFLIRAAQSPDSDTRQSYYRRIQGLLEKEAPYIPLFQLSTRLAVSNRIKGLTIHPALPQVIPFPDIKLSEF